MNKTSSIAAFVSLLLSPIALSGGSEPSVQYETPPPAKEWKFELGLYAFLPAVTSSLPAGDHIIDGDIGVSEILDHIELSFSGPQIGVGFLF